MNTLQTNDLADTMAPMGLNERVRVFLRDEKARRNLSDRDIAGMAEWSPSRVAQKLTGRTPMTLDEFESLCFVLGVIPTEAIRDKGLEFCAEMTPTELRMLERIRQLPKDEHDAIVTLLRLRSSASQVEGRGITPKRKIFGKPRSG